VDFDKLNKTPDVERLLTQVIKNETLRDPGELEVVLIAMHIENITYRNRFYEFCTLETKEVSNETIPGNVSVRVSVAVYASRGISWATAKLRSTDRCQIGTRVTGRLEELKSRFEPVMHPDSEIYVSAVSPIRAVGHGNVRFRPEGNITRTSPEGAITRALQGSWIKVGGGRPFVATSCLLVALALCVSMSAASWRRRDRHRRGMAVAAGYDSFCQRPASRIYHQRLEGLGRTDHSQALGQHDVLHFEAQ